MLLTMHGGGKPQSTLQVISVPAYVRKTLLSPQRIIECTCAQMMGKSHDVQFEIWFPTWNVGSMSGKWGEISDALKRLCVDVCCFQVVRWKGQGAKMIGNGFNFLWSKGCKVENGEGAIVAN